MSFASYVFIKKCTKSDAKRDEGLEIPEDVEYIRDIRYGKEKNYHTLDICWPKKALESGIETAHLTSEETARIQEETRQRVQDTIAPEEEPEKPAEDDTLQEVLDELDSAKAEEEPKEEKPEA